MPAQAPRPPAAVAAPPFPAARPVLNAPARRAPSAAPPPRAAPAARFGPGVTPAPTARSAPPAGRAKTNGGRKDSEHEILFQKYFKSVNPQRTYASQVKKAGNGNHYVVFTEGRRDDATGEVRKTRLFVYSEDFIEFFRMLQETAYFVRDNPVPAEVRQKRHKFWSRNGERSRTSPAPRNAPAPAPRPASGPAPDRRPRPVESRPQPPAASRPKAFAR